jgi:hypothetical protein
MKADYERKKRDAGNRYERAALRFKERYAKDEAFREKVKANSRAGYAKRKAAKKAVA